MIPWLPYRAPLLGRVCFCHPRKVYFLSLFHPWGWGRNSGGSTPLLGSSGSLKMRNERLGKERGGISAEPCQEGLEGSALAPGLGNGIGATQMCPWAAVHGLDRHPEQLLWWQPQPQVGWEGAGVGESLP